MVPVDAGAALAPDVVSSFGSSVSQVTQAIKESELGQRAPGVLQDVVQTIFKDDPNFRLLTPGGIVEVPPDQFFLQPTQIQEELQRVLIDPTTGETMGAQPGLEEAQQGTDGSSSEASAAQQSTNTQAASPSITNTFSSPNTQGPVSQPLSTPASVTPATTASATSTPATNASATSTPTPPSAPTPRGQPSSGSPANATGAVTPVPGSANASGTPASIAGGAKPIPAGPAGSHWGQAGRHEGPARRHSHRSGRF